MATNFPMFILQDFDYALARTIFLNGKNVNWYKNCGISNIEKNVIRYLTLMLANPAYSKRHKLEPLAKAWAKESYGVISGAILNPVTGKPYYTPVA